MAQELSDQSRTLVRERIPNYYKLEPNDQLRQALIVIKDDFYLYCERNLMIVTKTGELVPLVPNWAQRRLVDLVMEDLVKGVPVRYAILKARQMGLSTIIEALGYWWTATHKNTTSIIMAHNADASENLYNMFRRYYEHSHPVFQPKRKYNTRQDLVFDISDEEKEKLKAQGVEKMPGLNSKILTMVAKDGAGRSFTGSFFHGSEVAFWDHGDLIVASTLQAIPLKANTLIFLETTANGFGGYFYNEWQYAKKGESIFKPIFLAWHEHDEYELPGVVADYDDEEQELLQIFADKGYPKEAWDRKVLWRREKKKEFRANPELFYQEYPKDDMEAFISSGNPVFNQRMLYRMEQLVDANPPIFGEVAMQRNASTNKEEYLFKEIPKTGDWNPAPLKVWNLPEKGRKYVIGVDSSEGKIVEEGKRTNDYSVIDVTDAETLKTVARWRGHVDPDLLGDIAFDIGSFYNHALIGPEINNHGIAVVLQLRNRFYRNLYMRETADENQLVERLGKFGWKTDRRTKPKIIANLAAAIREGEIEDFDPVFISEAKTFVRDEEGRIGAQTGMFDDTVMAKAISLALARFNTISVDYAKENISKPTKRVNNANQDQNYNFDAAANGFGNSIRRNNRDAVARRRAARAAHRAGRQD